MLILRAVTDVARTKSWPVLERNLILMLWFDAEDREPMYLPREIEEIKEQGWVVHGRSEHTVYCHISVNLTYHHSISRRLS